MSETLEGKVALVTGAAQGIGRAIATGLAAEGAGVICADVLSVTETADEIRARGGVAHEVRLDVADPAQVTIAVELGDSLGGVDILVNNAGIFPRRPVLDLDIETWDRVMTVNLRGTFLCAREVAVSMRRRGHGGRIVNVSSGTAFVPTAQSAHYSASKAGILALTRVLALELAEHRITVNALAPGLVDTEQLHSFYSEEQLSAASQRIPAGRIGAPGDMVAAVIFLCSDGAGYVTGQTLQVNGGLFMH